MRRGLTVVIPCLDEEEAIGHLVTALRRVLDPEIDHVIVAGNGSRDGTAEVARQAGAGDEAEMLERLAVRL